MTIEDIITVAGGFQELAEIAGVHRTTVYWWKKTRRISVERAQIINAKLNIPLHEIRPDVWADPEKAAAQ